MIWFIYDLFSVEHGKSMPSYMTNQFTFKALKLDSGLSGVETVKECLKYGPIVPPPSHEYRDCLYPGNTSRSIYMSNVPCTYIIIIPGNRAPVMVPGEQSCALIQMYIGLV